jgi:hypothetical protein
VGEAALRCLEFINFLATTAPQVEGTVLPEFVSRVYGHGEWHAVARCTAAAVSGTRCTLLFRCAAARPAADATSPQQLLLVFVAASPHSVSMPAQLAAALLLLLACGYTRCELNAPHGAASSRRPQLAGGAAIDNDGASQQRTAVPRVHAVPRLRSSERADALSQVVVAAPRNIGAAAVHAVERADDDVPPPPPARPAATSGLNDAALTTAGACVLSEWSAWSVCSAARSFPRPPRAQLSAWSLPAAREVGASPQFESLSDVCEGDACMFIPDLLSHSTGGGAAADSSDEWSAAPPLPRVQPALPRRLLNVSSVPTEEEASFSIDDAPPLMRCATRDGTRAEARALAAELMAVAKAAPDAAGGVFVRVAWTVVHSGDTGKLSRAAIETQIAHLNAAYGGVADEWSSPGWDVAWRPDTPRAAGVFFTLADPIVYREDAAFFAGCSPTSGPDKSAAWNVDTRHSMNVYSCMPGGGLLGWTSFPQDMSGEDDGARSAVFVRWDTLPGVAAAAGTTSKYGLGNTLVHEAGHWLGLFHVFQGDTCSADAAAGDGVGDTHPQKQPTYGSCAANRVRARTRRATITDSRNAQASSTLSVLPWARAGGGSVAASQVKSTCPPGLDSIVNFMDYSDDSCMRLFTPQQIQARNN